MALTKEKYNAKTKTFFEETASKEELVEKLGHIEKILKRCQLDLKNDADTFLTLERQLLFGNDGINRAKRAIGQKVYYLSHFKIKKVYLKSLTNNVQFLDEVVIECKGEETSVSFKEIFISKKEAKCVKRSLQRYHLDKEHYSYFFKNIPYNKHTYLIEESPNSDTFRVYSKVLRTYWRAMTEKSYTIDELKDIYFLDIDEAFKKQKNKFKTKQAK